MPSMMNSAANHASPPKNVLTSSVFIPQRLSQ